MSKYMTVIYYMSIDRADKPWIGDRRLTEMYNHVVLSHFDDSCIYVESFTELL